MMGNKEEQQDTGPPVPFYEGMNIYQRLHHVIRQLPNIKKEQPTGKKGALQFPSLSHDDVTHIVKPYLLAAGIYFHSTMKDVTLTTETLQSSKYGTKTSFIAFGTVITTFTCIDNLNDFLDVIQVAGSNSDSSVMFALSSMSSAGTKQGFQKALGIETGEKPVKEITNDYEGYGSYDPKTGDVDYNDGGDAEMQKHAKEMEDERLDSKAAETSKAFPHVLKQIKEMISENGWNLELLSRWIVSEKGKLVSEMTDAEMIPIPQFISDNYKELAPVTNGGERGLI